jgi:hypothetical protein
MRTALALQRCLSNYKSSLDKTHSSILLSSIVLCGANNFEIEDYLNSIGHLQNNDRNY